MPNVDQPSWPVRTEKLTTLATTSSAEHHSHRQHPTYKQCKAAKFRDEYVGGGYDANVISGRSGELIDASPGKIIACIKVGRKRDDAKDIGTEIDGRDSCLARETERSKKS